MFFHFSKFGLQNLQKYSSKILADLFLITRKDNWTNVPSFVEIDGTKRQRQCFENGQFFQFSSKRHFLKFKAHFLQGIMGDI